MTVSSPFAIGLAPLDPAEWIVVDNDLERYLVEKDRLLADRPGDVFVAEEGTEAAQREVVDLLADHLPRRFPEIYRPAGNAPDRTMHVGHDRRVALDGTDAPLVAAARLVQEDLVLMRKGGDGWRLVAACVCFPSSWTLTEKFRRPMDAIHGPVPGFGAGTRMATLIERIFDNLRPELPAWRSNWSVHLTDELYHPHSGARRPGSYGGPSLPPEEMLREAAASFLRAERQTLRKLPVSGDILFTIRITLDPLASLADAPDRREIALGLVARIAAMDADQLAYKGLVHRRDAVIGALRAIAG